ncbi:MAG TPA: hypothetical protein PKK69_00165 [Ferruginibacter sp.]|nr:hypothetical protein [Ferruginibacter sp.]
MKQIFTWLTAAVMLTIMGCSPKIYKSSEFDSITAKHKLVAILPADVSITLRPNEMKKTTPEQLKELEEKTGTTVQDKMQTWFLKRSGKYKYTVQFQDISKTNALLAQNNIKYADLNTKTKEQICQLLGVDAVLSTKVSMKKPMSDDAAIAVGLIAGVWGSTNNVQTSISIHEAIKGDLVWKYDYDASGSVGSNTDRLVDALMRNASKKFPYNNK